MKISPFLEFATVAAGGAIGALSRWLLAEVIPSRPDGFPLATLMVNVVGCAFIGLAARRIGVVRSRRQRLEWWFEVTGVLGGFTTFSSFAVETERLAAGGQGATAVVYVAVTILAGFGAVHLTSGRPPVAGDPD